MRDYYYYYIGHCLEVSNKYNEFPELTGSESGDKGVLKKSAPWSVQVILGRGAWEIDAPRGAE